MKIAIVSPIGNLTSTPCIVSLVLLFARKGIHVDIYTIQNETFASKGAFSIFDDEKNVQLLFYPITFKSLRENIPLLLLGFFPWWIGKSLGKGYDFIIAAGIRALFVIGLYSIFTRSKYIYLSLELYIKKEMNSIKGKVFKYLESFFNKKASFSIIQDEQRAKILQRENGVKIKDILTFPNSPLREIKSAYPVGTLKRHGLNGKKIVLYAGSIFDPWAMTGELIKEAINWPDEWILLIHSRAKLSDIKKFIPEEYDIKSGKVVFSSEPLNENEYEQLVKTCHIGIALYNGAVSANIYYVGYSSGKIAQYLKCEKPVIINNLPLIGKIVKDSKCGVLVNKIQEVKDAIKEIEDNYESFSKNASYVYEHFLNPENYVEDIIKKLSYKI